MLGAMVKVNHQLGQDDAPPANPGMLNQVLNQALQSAKHDYLICLISDAYGMNPETKRLITLLSAHNDVINAFVYDPLEQEALENGDVIAGERLETSEPFLTADLLFSYDFDLSAEIKLQLYAGVKNIFNQTQEQLDSGMFRDAGYIYGPSLPRTLNFGIRIGNTFSR